MKKNTIFSLLCLLLLVQVLFSETITIQDCDDITIGNKEYANAKDGFIAPFEKPASDTLVIDLLRC